MPALYWLGNLIFDQHWSTNTMESALLEATFHEHDLLELRPRRRRVLGALPRLVPGST